MSFDYSSVYFPFKKVRKFQDRLIHGVLNAVDAGKVLIAHAPTGLGKTVAVLAPALKHVLESDSTIFFLTPRYAQHRLIIDTLKLIKEKNELNFKVTDLIGKKWMCPTPASRELSSSEFTQFCRDLKKDDKCSYYKNTRKIDLTSSAKDFLDYLNGKGPMHVNELISECAGAKLCPHEMALESGRKSKVIVCDYYHLFHDVVRNSFLNKMGKELKKSIIIVDEAHNLPQRIRDLMTYQLSTYSLKAGIRELREHGFEEEADAVAGILELFNLGMTEKEVVIERDAFIRKVVSAANYDYDELIVKLLCASEVIRKHKKRSRTHAIALFLNAWQGSNDNHARIMKAEKSRSGQEFVKLTYHCLDPAVYSEPVFTECKSAVLMSGTLTPIEMYQELLGVSEPMILELQNPFPVNNRLTIIDPCLTTRYSKRSEENYSLIAERINSIIKGNSSNTAVFFPSYVVMTSVLQYFNNICERELIIERQGLSKEGKDALLKSFKDYKDRGAVLCGVVAGSFSEGVDLPGKSLECIIIVGVPLQPPNLYSKALINYYDSKFSKGWEYGYLYPALTRVVQSAGRCIRSESDKGVIVLMDERYLWKNYLRVIPPEWRLKVSKKPERLVNEFLSTHY